MIFSWFPEQLNKFIPIGNLGAIKKFYIMATNSINKSVVTRVFNNVWAGLCRCGRFLKNAGQFVVGAVALLAMLVVVYNPIAFLVWSLASPKRAAEMLYDIDLPVFEDIVRFLNGWMVALYPFRLKKHFMAVRGINNYSAKLQCRYYWQVNRSSETVKKMSKNAVDLLWKAEDSESKKDIVNAKIQLSNEQFEVLLTNNLYCLVCQYFCKWTPSIAMINALLNIGTDMALDMVFEVAEVYGLSSSIIERVFSEFDEKEVSKMQEALNVYSQRQVVISTQNNEHTLQMWQTFCKNESNICFEAQKLMNLWQYKEYVQSGHTLDEKTVEFFMSKGDLPMCTLIFNSEQAPLSDKSKAFVAANPKLTTALLSCKSANEK